MLPPDVRRNVDSRNQKNSGARVVTVLGCAEGRARGGAEASAAPGSIDAADRTSAPEPSTLELASCPLQPVRHAHVAVHRGRGREVLFRFGALSCPAVELREAGVAVGDVGAHTKVVS